MKDTKADWRPAEQYSEVPRAGSADETLARMRAEAEWEPGRVSAAKLDINNLIWRYCDSRLTLDQADRMANLVLNILMLEDSKDNAKKEGESHDEH